jgi:hypothetical protein
MTAYQTQDDAPQTNEVVVAVFVDQDTAEQAIADLREAGLDEEDIVVSEQHDEAERVLERSGVTPAKGALQGAVSGGIVGGALGVLASLLLPGVGPELTGGLVGIMLAGGVLGSVAGGLIGALVTFGVADGDPEPGDHAGGTLVTVLTDGRSMDARTILGLLWKKRERRNLPSFNYFGPDRRLAAF